MGGRTANTGRRLSLLEKAGSARDVGGERRVEDFYVLEMRLVATWPLWAIASVRRRPKKIEIPARQLRGFKM